MTVLQIYKSEQFLEQLHEKRFLLPSLIVFSLIPIGMLGWCGFKDDPFVFSGSRENVDCKQPIWQCGFVACPINHEICNTSNLVRRTDASLAS